MRIDNISLLCAKYDTDNFICSFLHSSFIHLLFHLTNIHSFIGHLYIWHILDAENIEENRQKRSLLPCDVYRSRSYTNKKNV